MPDWRDWLQVEEYHQKYVTISSFHLSVLYKIDRFSRVTGYGFGLKIGFNHIFRHTVFQSVETTNSSRCLVF